MWRRIFRRLGHGKPSLMPRLKLGHHGGVQHSKQNCKIREQLRKHQHYRDLNLEPRQPSPSRIRIHARNSKTVSHGGRAIRRSAAVSKTSHSHPQSELHSPNFKRFPACHAAATGFQHNRAAEFPDLGWRPHLTRGLGVKLAQPTGQIIVPPPTSDWPIPFQNHRRSFCRSWRTGQTP